MIHDPSLVVARAVRMVTEGLVEAVDGTIVQLGADTLCVHGDTPDAALLAGSLRKGLEAANVAIKALKTP